jgi:hypothetical protein
VNDDQKVWLSPVASALVGFWSMNEIWSKLALGDWSFPAAVNSAD